MYSFLLSFYLTERHEYPFCMRCTRPGKKRGGKKCLYEPERIQASAYRSEHCSILEFHLILLYGV